MIAAPAPAPLSGWASRFSLLIERLCSVNTMDKNRFECTLKKQVCAILYRGGGVCRLCCHQPGFNSVPQVSTISWGRHTWKHLGLCQLWGDELRREVQGEGSSRASKISPDATAIPAHSQVKPAILPGKTAWESSAPFPGGLVTPGHGCFSMCKEFRWPSLQQGIVLYPRWPSQQGTCRQVWGPVWGGREHRAPSCDGAMGGGLRGCECSLDGFFPHQTAHPISAAALD